MTDLFAGPTENPQGIDDEEPSAIKIVRGRYALPDPITGKDRTWQRVTNFIRTIEDSYALKVWSERHLAYGLSRRPGLISLASTLAECDDDNKGDWDELIERAKDHSGAGEGADLGTSLHKLTERWDRGEMKWQDVPAALHEHLLSYRLECERIGVATVSSAIELTVCNPELGTVGTLDRLYATEIELCSLCGSDALHVGDLKTGANELKYGQMKTAMQEAIYARSPWRWSPNLGGWTCLRPSWPDVCPHVGIVMHLPIESAECTAHLFDLDAGWAAVEVAQKVMNARKFKGYSRPWSAL